MHIFHHLWAFVGIHHFQQGILVDPLKVEAVVHLPPLHKICQLQIIQGKDNFLQHFI